MARQAPMRSNPAALFMLVLMQLLAGCSEPAPSQSFELAAQGIYTGALSADGQYALIGSLNHGASLWRTDHERLFNWHHDTGEPADLVASGFAPDASRAVTTDPRTLVVWDTASGSAVAYWTTPAAVLDVTLLPAGEQVLMGLKDHSAILFDAESGDHLHTLLHDGVVGSVAVNDAGTLALTGSDDETAVLWDLRSGAQLQRFVHDNPVRTVALAPDGSKAFSAAQNRRLVIWDSDSGQPLHTLSNRNNGVTAARFSADGQRLLLGYVSGRIELWNAQQGILINSWSAGSRKPMHATGAAILALGFRSTGEYLALAGDGRLLELGG
jgi:WD40 repeat protein